MGVWKYEPKCKIQLIRVLYSLRGEFNSGERSCVQLSELNACDSVVRHPALNATRFDKVDVTLRVTQAAKRGPWHSSLGE